MYFSILVDALNEFMASTTTTLETEQELKDIRLLLNNTTVSDNTLYFVLPEQLTNFSNFVLPPNLAVSKSPWENSAFSSQTSEHNILFLDSELPPLVLFSKIQDIFSDYHEWYSQIQQTIISNADIQTILEMVSHKLPNPIALFDQTNTLIHWTGSFTGDYHGSIWEHILDKGYCSGYHTFEEEKELIQNIESSTLPYLHYSVKDSRSSMLSCCLKYHGKTIGTIGITDVNVPFTNGQIRLTSIIQTILENGYIHLFQSVVSNESTPFFIELLLCGQSVEASKLSHYLKSIGWKQDDQFQSLCFSIPVSFDNMDTAAYIYTRRLKEIFHDALICLHENFVIVILKVSGDLSLSTGFLKKTRLLYERFGLQCGISVNFFHFKNLRYYYIQSKAALMEGTRLSPNSPQYFYLDYYKSNIIHSLESATSLPSLCHPKILEFWENQNENQLVLIRTLYHYLLYGKNLTIVSDKLHIHRNTLLYRLNKISELLSIDLEHLDPDMQYYLLTSCEIVEFL